MLHPLRDRGFGPGISLVEHLAQPAQVGTQPVVCFLAQAGFLAQAS
jgi:hypothetical protein